MCLLSVLSLHLPANLSVCLRTFFEGVSTCLPPCLLVYLSVHHCIVLSVGHVLCLHVLTLSSCFVLRLHQP